MPIQFPITLQSIILLLLYLGKFGEVKGSLGIWGSLVFGLNIKIKY